MGRVWPTKRWDCDRARAPKCAAEECSGVLQLFVGKSLWKLFVGCLHRRLCEAPILGPARA